MVVRKRTALKRDNLSLPIDYRLNGKGLYDCKNIFDNKGITETRHGFHRYNSTSLSGSILSMSFYKMADGTRHRLAKVGTVISSVAASGAHTSVKTGLTSTTKHRAISFGGRHILAIESDGLFSWNGSTFTQLGQAVPGAPSAAAAASGSGLDAATYQVALTFYASSIGFETNLGTRTGDVVVAAGEKIAVTSIPTTASNALIDKVWIYFRNMTTAGPWLFWAEVSLGTATNDITNDTGSTQTPPTTHGAPLSGGGKYLSAFGDRIAYAGNSTYPNEAFISEPFLPDAFDDGASATRIRAEGQGAITGLGQGAYTDSVLIPYLAIFTKTSVSLYSEGGGTPALVTLSDKIGCVSHETIQLIGNDIVFMSETGWNLISNGVLSRLAGDSITDIFSRVGWNYEVNKSLLSSCFAAYYGVLEQYMCFVAEGSNASLFKAYVYEKAIEGFRVFELKVAMTCAAVGEDADGDQCVFVGDGTGYLYHYSVNNDRHDDDTSGTDLSIETFLLLPFVVPQDHFSSYNFRFLTVQALASDTAIDGRVFRNYNIQDVSLYSMSFPNPSSGFVLDVSQLDINTFGEDRVPVKKTIDINTTAETIMIGFYQDTADAVMALIAAQLDYNKNGNRNL